MSDNHRNPHTATNGLLRLGNINGLLQEVNGQHVVGNPIASAKEETSKTSDTKQSSAPKKKQPSKAETQVETKSIKSLRTTKADTFEYIASRLSKSEHRIDRKADRVVYIRPEIISAFRQSYRENATQAINEVLRKYIEDNKDRLRELRIDKGSLLDK